MSRTIDENVHESMSSPPYFRNNLKVETMSWKFTIKNWLSQCNPTTGPNERNSCSFISTKKTIQNLNHAFSSPSLLTLFPNNSACNRKIPNFEKSQARPLSASCFGDSVDDTSHFSGIVGELHSLNKASVDNNQTFKKNLEKQSSCEHFASDLDNNSKCLREYALSNTANDWNSITSSDWGDDVCELDRLESLRVQQMFDAIECMLFEPLSVQTFSVGKCAVDKQSSRKKTFVFDPGVKSVEVGDRGSTKDVSFPSRPFGVNDDLHRPTDYAVSIVQKLLPECQQWTSTFPHLRLLGARIHPLISEDIILTKKQSQPKVLHNGGVEPSVLKSCNPTENSRGHKLPGSHLNISNLCDGSSLSIRGRQLSPHAHPVSFTTENLTILHLQSSRCAIENNLITRKFRTPSAKLLRDDVAIVCLNSSAKYIGTSTTPSRSSSNHERFSISPARKINSSPLPTHRVKSGIIPSKKENFQDQTCFNGLPSNQVYLPLPGNPKSENIPNSSPISSMKKNNISVDQIMKFCHTFTDKSQQKVIYSNSTIDVKTRLAEELLELLFTDVLAAINALFSFFYNKPNDFNSSQAKSNISMDWKSSTKSEFNSNNCSPAISNKAYIENSHPLQSSMNIPKQLSPCRDHGLLNELLTISSKRLQHRDRTNNLNPNTSFSGQTPLQRYSQQLSSDDCLTGYLISNPPNLNTNSFPYSNKFHLSAKSNKWSPSTLHGRPYPRPIPLNSQNQPFRCRLAPIDRARPSDLDAPFRDFGTVQISHISSCVKRTGRPRSPRSRNCLQSQHNFQNHPHSSTDVSSRPAILPPLKCSVPISDISTKDISCPRLALVDNANLQQMSFVSKRATISSNLLGCHLSPLQLTATTFCVASVHPLLEDEVSLIYSRRMSPSLPTQTIVHNPSNRMSHALSVHRIPQAVYNHAVAISENQCHLSKVVKVPSSGLNSTTTKYLKKFPPGRTSSDALLH